MSDNWPNPSEWVSSIQEELRALDSWFLTYEGMRTGRLKLAQEDIDRLGIVEPVEPEITHQYARVVSRVIQALEQLPSFKDGDGLATLKGLRFDLIALDEGSKPDRLKPRPFASKGGLNRGRRVAKAHMVSFVVLLEELGENNTSARDTVADIFRANSFRVSSSSLFKWTAEVCGASPEDPDAPGRRLVDHKLAEWKADPDWPFAIDVAKRLIKAAASGTTISLAHTT